MKSTIRPRIGIEIARDEMAVVRIDYLRGNARIDPSDLQRNADSFEG